MARLLGSSKALVLGGTGYIGRKIPLHFQGVQLDKHKPESLINMPQLDFEYVINLAASKGNASESDSFAANYEYPKLILEKLSSDKVKWIQVSSYYEQQIANGRKDYYSLHKSQFREHLEKYSKANSEFRFISVFLPHIFGEDENKSRLIPSLKKLFQGEKVSFGDKLQQVPLLHVSDAVRAILIAMISNEEQINSLATPIYRGSLKELIQKLNVPNDLLTNAVFSENNRGYERTEINYPEELSGFEPTYSLDDLIQFVKKGL